MKRKYITVKTVEMWAKVQAMGDFEKKYKNGELWTFNGNLYYLSHLELTPKEMQEAREYYKGAETI